MIYKFGKIGKYHSLNNGIYEDYTCGREDNRFVVITLADGVSSCKFGAEGAKVAGVALADILYKKAEYFFEFSEDTIKDYLLSHVLYELEKYMENLDNKEVRIEDFSSTLAGVLFDRRSEKYIAINIGDSLIVASGFGRVDILSMPCDSGAGCLTTTTRGVKEETTVIKSDRANYEMLTIMSDGAWRECFDKNRLNKEVRSILSEIAPEELEEYLDGKEIFDDYSFIAACLKV